MKSRFNVSLTMKQAWNIDNAQVVVMWTGQLNLQYIV